jgi:hypothetical protein
MKTITELTIAAVVVAFLVMVAVQIDHAQAGASIGSTAGWGLPVLEVHRVSAGS